MLRVTGIDIDGNEIEIRQIISLTVNQDEDIPADDLTVYAAVNSELPELVKIMLFDGDRLAFSGIADEQQLVSAGTQAYVKIAARSMAAALLDNECRPVSYYCPSTSVIFRRHIEPCGISGYRGADIVLKEAINIPKSTTCWQAVQSFCAKAYGVTPRVEADGMINFNGINSGERLYFSNTDGINYSSVKENKKRCKELSDVWIKQKDGEGYVVNVTDNSAKSRGITRVRYLDATGAYFPTIAGVMLKNAKAKSYKVTVNTTERLLNVLGACVSLSDRLIGERSGLYVSSIFYNLRPDGEYTSLVLKKGES